MTPKTMRWVKQAERARKLASVSVGPVAELYLLHAKICEGKQRLAKRADVTRRV